MTLGEMMQAASAFITVQHSFNWLVENYPRLADWTTSACRLASLLVSLDRLDGASGEDTNARIVRKPAEDGALRLRDLSVTLDDGTAIVNEADIEIAPGEKVLVVGESGTGKSTLVRAIAGLWPWGTGEVGINVDGLSLMPQRPYVPLGTLRRAVTYPLSPETVDDAVVRKSVEDVGLGHLLDKLDQDERWDQVLSGGEKQRLGFARLLIQKPKVDCHGRGDRGPRSAEPGSVDAINPRAAPRCHARQRGASCRARSISHAQARAGISARRRAVGRG